MMAKTGFVKKLFIRLAILTPFVILPLYAIKVHLYTGYCDFEVYYKTALRLKAGAWNEVYNLAIDGSNPFRYTPPTLLFFRPLAELPYSFARVLFFLLNFTAYVLGFAYLARTLRLLRADVPLILSATLFLTLRYFLDSFTIGQVSGLMFLGFAMAQFYFVSGQHALAGRALVLPATLKLTPVLFFGLFQWRSARSSVLLGSLLIAISIIYTGGIDRFHYLIQTFSTTLTGDDSYFDSSHYGSQSLKSALLRFDQAFELIRLSHVKEVWIGALVLGTLGLLLSWNTKKPKSLEAKALSFNLGIFAYLLFMPQTFKYSMPFLAFPIAILLANKSTSLFIRPHRMKAVFWGFCFLVFGFGGKDVVGDYLFFGAQKASLPFFCMLGLWIATLREYRRSHISHLEASTPSAFSQEPLKNGTLDLSVIIVGTEEEIQRLAVYRRAFADAEIIELATTEERTRGMVLREAFVRSHGKNLVFMNPNQIVIDNFFERALSELKLGSSLVRSNRRLRESRFRVPGNLIRVAYRRHRLSVFANSLIQKFLKTRSGDLFSGNFVCTRELACKVFNNQSSIHRSFEIEFDLQAQGRGLQQKDLHVSTLYFKEDSYDFLLIESLRLCFEILRLKQRVRFGFNSKSQTPLRITADDWGISPGVNDGILELARRRIVRRVSILATANHVQYRLDELIGLPNVELGLHFDLTYEQRRGPLTGIFYWLADSKLRRNSVNALQNQIQKLKTLGVHLKYLDGHHHMHLLPGFLLMAREVLLREKILIVRIPFSHALWMSPKALLNILAHFASCACEKAGLRYMPCIYPSFQSFRDPARLRTLVGRHFEHEIIVHPSMKDDFKEHRIDDPYSSQRVIEFQSLRQALSP